MKIYAIILARGGSKGVSGKNIKELCGKPLIGWTIEEAKKSKFISHIIVNTDDEKIARVAKNFGAEVFARPKKLAKDLTQDLPVFTHHLLELKKSGDLPDIIVDLRATAPLRGVGRIDEGIKLLLDAGQKKADSVRAVSVAAKHPYKMWKIESNFLRPLFFEANGLKEPYNAPRQILPAIYQNNGAMNAFWVDTILKKKSVTGKKILGFLMEDWESINIDSELDFFAAEYIMRNRLKTSLR
ncbi:MAG: acylneuraminate cytidylyltransferase family protein [Patescibacteria group bacterium]